MAVRVAQTTLRCAASIDLTRLLFVRPPPAYLTHLRDKLLLEHKLRSNLVQTKKQNEPKDILNGCAEIAANFAYFKPTQKGQKLTKLASDREILFEIYFGSSMRNYAGSVSILPQVAIYCKRLKKLMQEELPCSTDLVLVSYLSYLTPRKQFRDWHSQALALSPAFARLARPSRTTRCLFLSFLRINKRRWSL